MGRHVVQSDVPNIIMSLSDVASVDAMMRVGKAMTWWALHPPITDVLEINKREGNQTGNVYQLTIRCLKKKAVNEQRASPKVFRRDYNPSSSLNPTRPVQNFRSNKHVLPRPLHLWRFTEVFQCQRGRKATGIPRHCWWRFKRPQWLWKKLCHLWGSNMNLSCNPAILFLGVSPLTIKTHIQ